MPFPINPLNKVMQISAVIFDLDGTLIESEEAWGMAFCDVLQDLGYRSSDSHPQTRGVSLKKNWEILLDKLNIKTDKNVEQLEAMTNKSFIKYASSVTLRSGSVEFIENLKDGGIKVGLATSTNWSVVDIILEQLDFHDVFDSITSGDEVINQKPDPDILLVEADKLCEKEENCLVIEDSPSGVEAAHRAGMKAAALIDEEDDQLDLSGADLVVESFSEITPRAIEGL